MTPAARLASAIELGGLTDSTKAPPDACFRDYFRNRRYAGSGDRRAVIARVIEVTRCRARLDWWVGRAGLEINWRTRVLAHVILVDGLAAEDVARLFSGSPYAPEPLNQAERAFVEAALGKPLNCSDMPPATVHECPDWLYPALRDLWGEKAGLELEALNVPAPVDIRVNIARTNRAAVLARLAEQDFEAAPTPYSPWGLRLAPSSRVAATDVLKEGLADIQDEGSQIIALMCDAAPGMTVIDLCAGAGGKTLALGAAMARDGKIDGQLIAADAEARRLAPLGERLRRAKLLGIAIREVGADELGDLDRMADRVLVDAPCSGSGTWRRRPDLRWRIQPDDVSALVAMQDNILAAAARLVRPGGQLIYATCSLDPLENEKRLAHFLTNHDTFAVVPAATIWAGLHTGTPLDCGLHLRLSPATTGTDGFFCSVVERRA